MKDLFDILTSLGTPLVRGTKAVLSGKLGREVSYVAWLVVVIQTLRAISHATGIVSGTLLIGALLVTTAVSVLTAFMTAGGNEYEPNSKNVQGKNGVLISMLYNGTLLGTIVCAILVGLVSLLSGTKEPGSLVFFTAIYCALHSYLVSYLIRRSAAQ
jgi:hypothetical protein